MTQEEKQILLKDLCARLPYRVKVQIPVMNDTITLTCGDISAYFFNPNNKVFLKPYLRPMSSMTEEEKSEEPAGTSLDGYMYVYEAEEYVDWLNAHHFDYRNLIEKGLAIEVTEDNNPYKD